MEAHRKNIHCPHCGAKLEINNTGKTYYASPVIKCRFCGRDYFDSDYRKTAVKEHKDLSAADCLAYLLLFMPPIAVFAAAWKQMGSIPDAKLFALVFAVPYLIAAWSIILWLLKSKAEKLKRKSENRAAPYGKYSVR